MVSFGPLSFENTAGFLGLLSLIPLIILYLIRPKPTHMEIPSLMFFFKTSGANKITSFFKQITRDWLFIIQLLALLLLSLILAKPFLEYTHNISAENTVLVLDASASSNVKEGSKTRFDLAINKAKDLLGKRNTIIIAKNIPLVGIKDASQSEALDYLKTIKPLDTSTRLGDAIILAGEALAGKEGSVIVLSDFINTGGQDPDTAKAVLQSKGLIVEFINVASANQKSNVGIIDLNVDDENSIVYIKNFNKEEKSITLNVGNTQKELLIPADSVEPFSFQTSEGITKLTISPGDDFMKDNLINIAAPKTFTTNVLLITNNKSVFLEPAMKAGGNIIVTVAEPPVISEGKFDVYVIHNVDPAEIITGMFEGILKNVKEGAGLVIHAQDNSEEINYKGLLPLEIEGTRDAAPIFIEQLNRFTKNIDFGKVDHFPSIKTKQGFTTIASADKSPVIAYYTLGKGKAIYYGILEKASDFKLSPNYPIFWNEVLAFLSNKENVKDLNFKTDQTLFLDNSEKIETPSKTISSSTILLEEVGSYKIKDKIISANLLNEYESTINTNQSFGQKAIDYELQSVKEKRKLDLELPFLIAILLLFLLEILYVKFRGDL